MAQAELHGASRDLRIAEENDLIEFEGWETEDFNIIFEDAEMFVLATDNGAVLVNVEGAESEESWRRQLGLIGWSFGERRLVAALDEFVNGR